jgi:hypothetical protein
VAGRCGWEDQLSCRNLGLKYEEFRELPPAARPNLVGDRGLCRLCLSRYDPEGKRMHKRCQWKNRMWNELCQEQNKCRQTHHRLLHVDAEDERSLQTARPAKPAKPPDRQRRSPAYSRAKASRDVPAAGKRRLTTSRMLAGTLGVAATQKESQKHGFGAADGGPTKSPGVISAGVRPMPVTTVIRETAQSAEAAETVAPSQMCWGPTSRQAAHEFHQRDPGIQAQQGAETTVDCFSKAVQGRGYPQKVWRWTTSAAAESSRRTADGC